MLGLRKLSLRCSGQMFIVHVLSVFLFTYQSRTYRTSCTLMMKVDSSGSPGPVPSHSAMKEVDFTSFTVPASLAAFAHATLAEQERISGQQSHVQGNVSSASATPQGSFTTQGLDSIISGFRPTLRLIKESSMSDPLPLQTIIMISTIVMLLCGLVLLCDPTYVLNGSWMLWRFRCRQ